MALTPPTVAELGEFRDEPYDPTSPEAAYAGKVLIRATDLIWINTGLDAYPTDERARRITEYAIFDLTLWLISQAEHRDEINSPFSGERIGSYSYTKMQQAKRGEETGIYWLDQLFKMLRMPQQDGANSWSSSENVFNPAGLSYAEQQHMEKLGVPESYLHDFFGR